MYSLKIVIKGRRNIEKLVKSTYPWYLVLIGFLLLGCSNNESASNNKGGNSDSGPQEISIMLNLHVPEVPDKRLEELIEKETNTQLDIRWYQITIMQKI